MQIYYMYEMNSLTWYKCIVLIIAYQNINSLKAIGLDPRKDTNKYEPYITPALQNLKI